MRTQIGGSCCVELSTSISATLCTTLCNVMCNVKPWVEMVSVGWVIISFEADQVWGLWNQSIYSNPSSAATTENPALVPQRGPNYTLIVLLWQIHCLQLQVKILWDCSQVPRKRKFCQEHNRTKELLQVRTL